MKDKSKELKVLEDEINQMIIKFEAEHATMVFTATPTGHFWHRESVNRFQFYDLFRQDAFIDANRKATK